MKIKSKVFVFLFAFFMLVFNASALEVIDFGNIGNGSRTSGDGGCGSGGAACIHKDGSNFAVAARITLVDKDGKIVEGTKSIDLTGSKTLSVARYSQINGNKYLYKYSEEYGEGGTGDVLFAYINGGPTFKNMSNGTFFNDIKDVMSSEYFYDTYSNLSLLDVILNLNGFLSNGQRLMNNMDRREEIYKNNYYLLIEPTAFMYYGSKYLYGTATEFASMIYNYTYMGDFSRNASWLRKNFGCFLYTNINDKKNVGDKNWNFTMITQGYSSKYCSYAAGDNIPRGSSFLGDYSNVDWWKRNVSLLKDTSYGYGVYVMGLTDILPPPDPKSEEFNLNLCESSDGVISFNTLSGSPVIKEVFLTDDFKIGSGDQNSSIYCYDAVTYNFNDLINALSADRKAMTSFAIPSGKATIIRRCSVPNSISYTEEQVKADVMKSYGFGTEKISLNLYGKDNKYAYKYDFTPSIVEISSKKTNKTVERTTIMYTIGVEYSINDKLFLPDSFAGNYVSQISFGDVRTLFGASNKVISSLIAGNSSHSLSFTDGTLSNNKFSCNFNSEVKRNRQEIVFRTISLSNPFPARDGTSRLPGYNWINNEENFVDKYISEDIYDKDPIYTITLDYSTMVNIRRYNADASHSYSNINSSLECNPSSGRECLSSFLRNKDIIDKFAGSCAVGYDMCMDQELVKEIENCNILNLAYIPCYDERYDIVADGVVDSNDVSKAKTYKKCDVPLYDPSLVEKIHEYMTLTRLTGLSCDENNLGISCDVGDYDLNNDNAVDEFDLKIAKDMGAKYYGCAGKSYKSGGPITSNN